MLLFPMLKLCTRGLGYTQPTLCIKSLKNNKSPYIRVEFMGFTYYSLTIACGPTIFQRKKTNLEKYK